VGNVEVPSPAYDHRRTDISKEAECNREEGRKEGRKEEN
jgi:hypothetical protein